MKRKENLAIETGQSKDNLLTTTIKKKKEEASSDSINCYH